MKDLVYTLLTLKYGVNLLNAPISSVLRQNLRAILGVYQRVLTLRYSDTQIISYSDTKVSVLVVMECERARVIYVYEVIV